MGTEMIVALGALVLSVVAFVKVQGGSSKLEAALKTVRLDEEQLDEALSARIDELDLRASTFEAPAPNLGDAPSGRRRGLESTVQILEMRTREVEALLCSLVSEDEARHLWNISRGSSITYDSHPGVQGELRSLVRRGLIKKKGDFKIHELPTGFELSKHFELSENGETLLSLRKHLEATDRVEATSIPPRATAS